MNEDTPHKKQLGVAAIKTRNMSRKDAKAAKVTGQGPSSGAKARDLRKISPGVYPELIEGSK